MVHIWPHIGKAKMCLRGGSFFQCQLIFSSIWNITMKNDWVFNHPLWSRVKALDCHAVSPGGSNPSGSRMYIFWRNLQFFLNFWKIYFQQKKLPLLKHILALPTFGEICTNLEMEPFEITNFDLGHPVVGNYLTR